jgi:hypothetical protein
MDIPGVSKSIRRIAVLQRDPSGRLVPVVVYRRDRSTKKGTRGFKIFERATRRIVEAQRSVADSYLSRHDKSNVKRRDGWIRDLPFNLVRSGEKARRALKLRLLP